MPIRIEISVDKVTGGMAMDRAMDIARGLARDAEVTNSDLASNI